MLKAMRSANKITAHTVNTELSFHVLMYLKNAGHPLYAAIILPEFEQFSKDITALSNKAFDSIIVNDDAVTLIMENRMENQENGLSGLFNSNHGSILNKDVLTGIQKMVNTSRNISDEITETKQKVGIEIESQLLNEYKENHILFGGTFPFEFTLGVPKKFSKGHFPMHMFHRLLESYTNEF